MNPDAGALSIAGIDTGSALRRIGGKRERYESLLRKFAKQQAGAVEEIRTALAAGDAATAERGAHSLKGAAAALGANTLAEAAAKTETSIKTGRGMEDALKSLSACLVAVVKAISDALPDPAT